MFNLIRNHLARTQLCNQILFRETRNTINRLGCSSVPSRSASSESAAYDGDGKTTVTVLNQDDTSVNFINTYSSGGFRLSNNLFITGSILIFPTNVFSWNVRKSKDITLDTLLLFDILVPKIKIVIIGYGQYGEPYDASIPYMLKKKGISCEMLATPNAITTYNYLVHDSVHVAGAFIPVKDDVYMATRDYTALREHDIMHKEMEYRAHREDHVIESPYAERERFEKYIRGDPNKKKFDE